MEIPKSRCACLKKLEHLVLRTATALFFLAGSYTFWMTAKPKTSQVPDDTSGSCSDRSLCCSTTSRYFLLPEARPQITRNMNFCACVEVITYRLQLIPYFGNFSCNIHALWLFARLALLCGLLSHPLVLFFLSFVSDNVYIKFSRPKKPKWKEGLLRYNLQLIGQVVSSAPWVSLMDFSLDGFTRHSITKFWAAPRDPLSWNSHKGGNMWLLHQKPQHQTHSLLQNTDTCVKKYLILRIQTTGKSWFFKHQYWFYCLQFMKLNKLMRLI